MTDHLHRLAAHALDELPSALPRVASRFEPAHDAIRSETIPEVAASAGRFRPSPAVSQPVAFPIAQLEQHPSDIAELVMQPHRTEPAIIIPATVRAPALPNVHASAPSISVIDPRTTPVAGTTLTPVEARVDSFPSILAVPTVAARSVSMPMVAGVIPEASRIDVRNEAAISDYEPSRAVASPRPRSVAPGPVAELLSDLAADAPRGRPAGPTLLPAAPPAVARAPVAPQPSEVAAEPVVQVTIGRIEVRATPTETARKAGAKPAAIMGLDEYLRRREKGGGP